MKVISIFNQKGGVGKSTSAGNLMSEFTKRGKPVLGVDIDPQAHLTKFLVKDADDGATICELLSGEAKFIDVAQGTVYGDIVPSDRSLATRLKAIADDPAFIFRLRQILSDECDTYDYVIIDCPPAVNQLTVAALVASDYVLIPTEAEYFSMDGVCEISRTIEQVRGSKYLNPSLQVLGIFFTRYRSNLTIARDMGAVMEQAAKELFDSQVLQTRIPNTCDVPESQAARKAVADYKSNSKAATAYSALAEEVLEAIE